MNPYNDLYVILDVGRAASLHDIKRAFRRLARRYHPDINPGNRAAEERFKQITEAYEILSSAPKRRFYDENGFYVEPESDVSAASTVSIRFQGFDFSGASGLGSIDSIADFLRGPDLQGPERGEDLEHVVSISFSDSMRGLRTRFAVHYQAVCELCGGAGHSSGAQMPCAECRGEGRIPRIKGRLQFSVHCSACGGSGQTWRPCTACGGEGRVPGVETLDVELPPGVGSGTRIRLDARGNAGRRGGPAGDINVIINVTPHPTFTRAGDNIQCSVPITFWEAALGAKIEVPTIDGRATVRIPPGTQSGQTLRLRGLGAPSLARPGLRGDQLITAHIVAPRVGDERSKAILRELARLNPDDPRSGMF